MPKVFISHRWAEGEHEFARELKKKLEEYQDITALLDEYEMLPGDTIKDWMDDTIQKGCDVFLFVLSPHSLKSEYCQYELKQAHQTGVPIIPVYLRACEIPESLQGILFADFREDFKLSFDSVTRLVDGIRRQAEKSQLKKSSTPIGNERLGKITVIQPANDASISEATTVPLLEVKIQREKTYPELPTNINSWKITLENNGSVKANEVVLDIEIPSLMKHSTEGLQELEPVLSNNSHYTRFRYTNAGDTNSTFFPPEKTRIVGIDLPQKLFINSEWAIILPKKWTAH